MVRLCLRTGVGRFNFKMYMHEVCLLQRLASAAPRNKQEQTQIILSCSARNTEFWPSAPPNGIHGLAVLDNESVNCLLNPCPDVSLG